MGVVEILLFGRVDCENLWAFFVCVVVGDSFQILSRVPDQYLKIRANLALVLGYRDR